MTGLIDQIRAALTQAIRDRDQVTSDALRLLMARIKNQQIDKGQPLSEAEVIKLIRKQVKKQQEEIDFLRQANRPDRLATEQAKLKVLERFLPPEMTNQQIKAAILSVVPQDKLETTPFGPLMGQLVKQLGDKIPSDRLAQVLRQLKADDQT